MLPVNLPIGMVSIYGSGSAGYYNIISPTGDTNIKFGVVNQMYNQFSGIRIGQSVMYNEKDVVKLFYSNDEYSIVPENKITLIEIEPS